MNSPFRVRLKSHRPGLPPRPDTGLPAGPAPLFPFGGAKVHLFSEPPNFSRKIFRKVFFSTRLPPPLALAPLPRSRETGPQKYCFFPFRQTFSKEIFEKIFNKLTVSTRTPPDFSSPTPRERGSGLQNAPRLAISHASSHGKWLEFSPKIGSNPTPRTGAR